MPVSQPQVQVSAGGSVLPGVISVDIEHVGYFASGRFVLVCALGVLQGVGASYFLALGAASVSINIGVLAGASTNIFTGRIDNIVIDVLESTATLTGRDLSCLLIDTEIAEAFANQTSSQIAETIAGRHQLTANVTATKTSVGQYYDLDHARSALGLNSRSGTEWNLLSWLALIEGFSLSVQGKTLNFGPSTASASISLVPGDCIELSLDMVTAIPVTATVKSWNTRGKAVVQQTAGAGSGIGATLIRPNLTALQASTYAMNHLSSLTRQKSMISLVMPGELTLLPGSNIMFSETKSTFDQSYCVETIRRSIDSRRGFTQSVRAYAVS